MVGQVLSIFDHPSHVHHLFHKTNLQGVRTEDWFSKDYFVCFGIIKELEKKQRFISLEMQVLTQSHIHTNIVLDQEQLHVSHISSY